MATGYILILAILVLGGVIATVGDRIGMRVGKARLTLFNLRPRQTATVISILTGSVVSGTTLALLFAVSDQLRTGVFELETLQDDLKEARQDLQATQSEKTGVEEELATAVRDQIQAQQRLRQINESLQTAVERQATTQARLNQTQKQLQSVSQQAQQLRSEIGSLQSERRNLLEQQAAVRAQIAQRDQEIAQRDQELSQRDQEIVQRDREIDQRDQAIAQREARLQKLQEQQAFLEEQVEQLDREFLGLRQGSVALGRNEPILARLVQVRDPEQTSALIRRLLQEANWLALQNIDPGADQPTRQIIRIASADVEQLADRISDGQEYIVRFLSAANYIVGEPCVIQAENSCIEVFADATVNRLVYEQGQQLAETTLETANPSDQELISRLQLLAAATQFRGSQDGVIDDRIQIADGRSDAVLQFLEQIQTTDTPVVIRAVAANPIFTIGPIQIELVATQQGQILFSTLPLPESPAQTEENAAPE
ncbi:MAG: DUF3084 domain-containing protein [Leptolyngbya sp. SIO4C5]|nr:DUF3084 domain-containing protein [Leptolyngbya sp. SIO4C5]